MSRLKQLASNKIAGGTVGSASGGLVILLAKKILNVDLTVDEAMLLVLIMQTFTTWVGGIVSALIAKKASPQSTEVEPEG